MNLWIWSVTSHITDTPTWQRKHRSIIPYYLHNHFSNQQCLVSSPLGINLFAVLHLLDAPKFLCQAGFSIKLLICCVSGLSSPSHTSLDLNPLSPGDNLVIIDMSPFLNILASLDGFGAIRQWAVVLRYLLLRFRKTTLSGFQQVDNSPVSHPLSQRQRRLTIFIEA